MLQKNCRTYLNSRSPNGERKWDEKNSKDFLKENVREFGTEKVKLW